MGPSGFGLGDERRRWRRGFSGQSLAFRTSDTQSLSTLSSVVHLHSVGGDQAP